MKSKTEIGIVGPCAAGKSTLMTRLRELGINAGHIAQEHSYVPDMWRRITNPDLLIYLDVSFDVSMNRRRLDWKLDDYYEQVRRLRHARQNADLYLHTDILSIQEVFEQVVQFLKNTPGSWTIR